MLHSVRNRIVSVAVEQSWVARGLLVPVACSAVLALYKHCLRSAHANTPNPLKHQYYCLSDGVQHQRWYTCCYYAGGPLESTCMRDSRLLKGPAFTMDSWGSYGTPTAASRSLRLRAHSPDNIVRVGPRRGRAQVASRRTHAAPAATGARGHNCVTRVCTRERGVYTHVPRGSIYQGHGKVPWYPIGTNTPHTGARMAAMRL